MPYAGTDQKPSSKQLRRSTMAALNPGGLEGASALGRLGQAAPRRHRAHSGESELWPARLWARFSWLRAGRGLRAARGGIDQASSSWHQ